MQHDFVETVPAPAPPCTTCWSQLRCKQQELACSAFMVYLSLKPFDDAPRNNANHQRYVRLYRSQDRAYNQGL
jgi:hypothetical protein